MLIWRKQNNHNYTFIDRSEKQSLIQKMKSSCLSLWGLSCLAIVMADGVQIMVGMLSEPSQAAFFAVAVRISGLVAFILLAINGILSPKFAEISTDSDLNRLQSVYRSATRLMLLVTLPILVVIFIFAGDLLLIFGEQFFQATLVLRILVIAQFFKVAVGSVGQLLIMSGHEKCQRNNLFFSVLLLMLICALLIPLYGALGGAVATLRAVALNNLLGLLQVKRKLGITLF
jgi:O-antigen/teichoic acid export membrane protein